MINRTGLYVLKQDVACRCSDSRWTVKAGTEIEVTNVQPEKNVFYSYALGGWHKADIQAILVVPYQSEKVLIKKTGDGQSYFLSLADCSQVGDGAYKGKAKEVDFDLFSCIYLYACRCSARCDRDAFLALAEGQEEEEKITVPGENIPRHFSSDFEYLCGRKY